MCSKEYLQNTSSVGCYLGVHEKKALGSNRSVKHEAKRGAFSVFTEGPVRDFYMLMCIVNLESRKSRKGFQNLFVEYLIELRVL